MNVAQKLEKLIKAEAPGSPQLSPFESRLHDEAAAAFVYEHGAEVLKEARARDDEIKRLEESSQQWLRKSLELGIENGRLRNENTLMRELVEEWRKDRLTSESEQEAELAELARLHEIERAAIEMVADNDQHGYSNYYTRMLAKACRPK